ncbi:polyphosphate kinase 2 [Bosea minatitlanensis]|uniref:ADP/GDP-polyphosphate phosphotransferase n=1 Tax=Bosea minatitlanensis TaxID=128782 RepID=A0ABW0F8Z3_9HYPH|nr:polyphosphate kinase 2 [Bosea minatitlanensis]MCT4495065.1 polyphosphate kinase 2 [Bosea minatitlanensis]
MTKKSPDSQASAAVAPSTAGEPQRDKPGKAKAFDIEAEILPESIVDAAYHSGGYPYGKRMKRKRYSRELEPLQIELQKLTRWAQKQGERIVIVFEGRDGAGKGGTIARFTQHLNPRHARVVALPKPSDTEQGQWYFQRYASEMPTAGEMVFFDRSWYNRAGVERVMDFCKPEETEQFLREAPVFEGMLARDGIRIVKLFLTIGREMQMTRLHARWHDPLKRWKLSPIDFEAIPRFDDYSRAFDAMLARTSTEAAPWFVVRSNDKLRARLNAIRHVLRAIPYKGKDETAIGPLDDKVVVSVARYLDKGGEPES